MDMMGQLLPFQMTLLRYDINLDHETCIYSRIICSKDKKLLYSAFPSLSQNLTPMAQAYGLELLELPDSVSCSILETASLVESVLSSILSPLDIDSQAHIC